MNRHLLLISNSTNAGEAYLAWPKKDIEAFFKKFNIKRVLFVPYAGVASGYDAYAEKVGKVYNQIMETPAMVAYNEAKTAVEGMINHINAIVNTAVEGGDPMLVEEPSASCTGSCSSCSGCH